MSKSQDYPDSLELMEGVTMTFEPQVRIVKIRGAPDDDIFRVPSHWHEDHDEIMTIYEGRLKITLGGQTKVYTPESGEVFLPRGVPHSIESFKGEACMASERTNPTEFDKKELFFRNLFAIPGGLASGGLVPMMQVFYHGDGYPAFPIHIALLEKAFVSVLGGYLAPLLGYRLKYESLKQL
ncbi:hypothetical protein GG344DRAFT_57324 [Lentinula edodes]|nr:hypothetical protein GG344DRAFT_57324 [Lentinula edodes]